MHWTYTRCTHRVRTCVKEEIHTFYLFIFCFGVRVNVVFMIGLNECLYLGLGCMNVCVQDWVV